MDTQFIIIAVAIAGGLVYVWALLAGWIKIRKELDDDTPDI